MGSMAATPAESLPQDYEEAAEWPMSGRWPAPGTIDGAWTVADLGALPEVGLRYEIIDGLLLVSPSPIPLHQRIVFRVARILDDACLPASHEVLPAPVDWLIDEHTVVVPDIVVVPLPSGKSRFVDRPPSIEVFNLADGDYALQVRAVGEETVTVSGPLDVTVTTAALTGRFTA